jgi:AraC-like DNA-binding protein
VRLLCPSGPPGLTLAVAQASRASQPRHAHDSLTLGVVTAGTRRIATAGVETLLPQGAVFILAPGQVHSCAPVETDGNASLSPGQEPPACSYLALSIAPATLPPELAKFRPATPGVDDPALAEALLRLAEALAAPTGLLERQSLLAQCLELLPRHGCAQTRQEEGGDGQDRQCGEAGMSAAVSRARRLIEENLETGVDLAGLAQACGVDMFALHRAFTRALGLPPHSFQTHLRLRRAKELLRGGASLSEAALESGFCDQAHMTRHFARAVGLSPARYARAHRQKTG